jgi:hypothetical protein
LPDANFAENGHGHFVFRRNRQVYCRRCQAGKIEKSTENRQARIEKIKNEDERAKAYKRDRLDPGPLPTEE